MRNQIKKMALMLFLVIIVLICSTGGFFFTRIIKSPLNEILGGIPFQFILIFFGVAVTYKLILFFERLFAEKEAESEECTEEEDNSFRFIEELAEIVGFLLVLLIPTTIGFMFLKVIENLSNELVKKDALLFLSIAFGVIGFMILSEIWSLILPKDIEKSDIKKSDIKKSDIKKSDIKKSDTKKDWRDNPANNEYDRQKLQWQKEYNSYSTNNSDENHLPDTFNERMANTKHFYYTHMICPHCFDGTMAGANLKMTSDIDHPHIGRTHFNRFLVCLTCRTVVVKFAGSKKFTMFSEVPQEEFWEKINFTDQNSDHLGTHEDLSL